MGWGTALSIGSNILGGLLGGRSARSAARRQEAAAREANRLLGETQEANYADLSPYRDIGSGATGRLASLLGVGGSAEDPRYGELTRRFSMADYEEDPGLAFRREQGEQAINRNALARGRFNSGSALKELQRYNSGLASQEFGNAFERWRAQSSDIAGRLGGASGIGQRAVESGNADRAALRGQIAGNLIGIGNAQGAARIASGNALLQGLQGATDWGMNALRQRPPTPRSVSNYSPLLEGEDAMAGR
jgi:hypothetical protein